MDDVEGLIRQTLRAQERDAPEASTLLASVHARSRRLHRRRVARGTAVVLAVVGAAVAVPGVLRSAGPDGVVVTGDPAGVRRTAGPVPTVGTGAATSGTPSTTGPGAGPSSPGDGVPSSGGTAGQVTLASGRRPALTFPYQLDRTTAARMRPTPVISLRDGILSAGYEPLDPWADADITLAVSAGRPAFPAAGQVREARTTVRGHQGWLRTVTVSPANELTLYWQERSGQWVQLRTDDSYSAEQVVRFAEGLAAGRLAAVAPFTFDPAPAGMVPGTLTDAAVGFRPASARPGADAVTCTLLTRRPLHGAPVQVGASRATISQDARGTTLMVDQPDEDAVLVITVRSGYLMRQPDLLRFAAGVRFTDRADPAASATAAR